MRVILAAWRSWWQLRTVIYVSKEIQALLHAQTIHEGYGRVRGNVPGRNNINHRNNSKPIRNLQRNPWQSLNYNHCFVVDFRNACYYDYIRAVARHKNELTQNHRVYINRRFFRCVLKHFRCMGKRNGSLEKFVRNTSNDWHGSGSFHLLLDSLFVGIFLSGYQQENIRRLRKANNAVVSLHWLGNSFGDNSNR